jgi:predicted CoA-binding protein
MITLSPHTEVEQLLRRAKTLAIVGLSPKENRPSNMVGRYLISAGYTIYPVNPGQTEIFGLKCYPNLSAIPASIDIVDIFRRSEEVFPFVEEAVKIGAGAVWMQLGVINHEAAEYARQHGLAVIMDRCIKVDHSNLL